MKCKEERQQIHAKLQTIYKGDISELRSYKYPPNGVKMVGEAVCYLFAKEASWKNFTELVVMFDAFKAKILSYDIATISEYALKCLEKYVEQTPEFKPEYIMKMSRICSILCEWVINVYLSKKLGNQLEGTTDSNSSYETLSEYIVKNSYFMYWWPAYYGAALLKHPFIKTIDELIQVLDKSVILPEKFISIYDHSLMLRKYSENEAAFRIASQNMPILKDTFKLANKYARSQSARVSPVLRFI